MMKKNLFLSISILVILFSLASAYDTEEDYAIEKRSTKCGKSFECLYKKCRKNSKHPYRCRIDTINKLLNAKQLKKAYAKCGVSKECSYKACRKVCTDRMCHRKCNRKAKRVARKAIQKGKRADAKKCGSNEKCQLKSCRKWCKIEKCKPWKCRVVELTLRYEKNKNSVNKEKEYKKCAGQVYCIRDICRIGCGRDFVCRRQCSYVSGKYKFIHTMSVLKKKYAKCNFNRKCIRDKCSKHCKYQSCKDDCKGTALKLIAYFKPKRVSKEKEFKKCKKNKNCLFRKCDAFCFKSSCYYHCRGEVSRYIRKHSDVEGQKRRCNFDMNCLIRVCMSSCSGRGCYRGCRYSARNYIRDNYHEEEDEGHHYYDDHYYYY